MRGQGICGKIMRSLWKDYGIRNNQNNKKGFSENADRENLVHLSLCSGIPLLNQCKDVLCTILDSLLFSCL